VTGELANLDFESRDRVLVARLTGEIDMSNAIDLSASLTERITNDVLGVVIDLTGMRYLDSAGILMLFRLSEHLEASGQGLRIVLAPGSVIAKTLELVDLPRVVGMADSTASAVAELGAEAPG
jgi:anti-sigma B factor antagonist